MVARTSRSNTQAPIATITVRAEGARLLVRWRTPATLAGQDEWRRIWRDYMARFGGHRQHCRRKEGGYSMPVELAEQLRAWIDVMFDDGAVTWEGQ